jgi:hypothetical protein
MITDDVKVNSKGIWIQFQSLTFSDDKTIKMRINACK